MLQQSKSAAVQLFSLAGPSLKAICRRQAIQGARDNAAESPGFGLGERLFEERGCFFGSSFRQRLRSGIVEVDPAGFRFRDNLK